MNFKSLPQLLDHFKEESTGIAYYESLRWGDNPTCPHCGAEKPYKTTRGWKCSNNKCYKKFTVRVGTIFENSKISFRIWFAAIYLATAHKKNVWMVNDLWNKKQRKNPEVLKQRKKQSASKD